MRFAIRAVGAADCEGAAEEDDAGAATEELDAGAAEWADDDDDDDDAARLEDGAEEGLAIEDALDAAGALEAEELGAIDDAECALEEDLADDDETLLLTAFAAAKAATGDAVPVPTLEVDDTEELVVLLRATTAAAGDAEAVVLAKDVEFWDPMSSQPVTGPGQTLE